MSLEKSSVRVEGQKTVYISFTGAVPNCFVLRQANGAIYYFRYLKPNETRIKFNVVQPGIYYSETPYKVVKIVGLEDPGKLPVLPSAERDRIKETKVVYNPNLQNTARIFTQTGVIEVGQRFYQYPPTIRLFLLLHEVGHYFYLKEESCDLYALVNYLRMGYNKSMAFYALSKILQVSPANIQRLKTLLTNIQKTQSEKL